MVLMESAELIGQSSLFVWLMDQLRALAELRVPFLTAIMSAVTYLGHEMVFLVVAMILAWCVDKRYGYRFLGMFMIGSFLQQALKAAFMIPRPWIIDPNFLPVENAIAAASDYSFPSGHTLTAIITLGGLAMCLKKKWAYAAAVVLSAVVAFSRMYLGVHTLLDVGVGFLLGILVLVFFAFLFRSEQATQKRLNAVLIIGTALSVGLLMWLILRPAPSDPSYLPMALGGIDNAFVLCGAAIGLLIGKLIDDRFVHFETEAPFVAQLVKVAVGMIVVLAVRGVLKKLFGGDAEPNYLHGVRYLIMTVVAVGFYPILFRVFNRIGVKR